MTSSSMPAPRWAASSIQAFAILCLLGAVAMGARLYKDDIKPPAPDGYAGYAYGIATHGTYSFGTNPDPGIGRAPAYPLFLAAMMRLDDGYRDFIACWYAGDRGQCTLDAGIVPYAQMLLAVGAMFLAYLTARLLGAGRTVTLVFCAYGLWILSKNAVYFRHSEALAIPLFGVVSYFLARWFAGSGRKRDLIIAGLALGALALTRPGFLYFAAPLALAVVLLPVRASPAQSTETESQVRFGGGFRTRLLPAVCIIVAMAVVVTPWIARNKVLFDRPEIGTSGVVGVLALRHQFNQMTLKEAACSFIYWIPDAGDGWTKSVCGQDMHDRFDFYGRDSFYNRAGAYGRQLRAQGLSGEDLVRHYRDQFLANPVRHSLVSIPLAWRGFRDVFLFLPFFLTFIFLALKYGRWWHIGIAAPILVNIAFHAGATQFIPRFGIPMLVGLVPMAAITVQDLADTWRKCRG